MTALTKQIEDAPDAAKKAALQKQLDEASAKFEKVRLEYRQVRPVAMTDLDEEAEEIAREALDQEIELALKAGIPKARVDELTNGYVPGQTADLEQIGLMTDRLFEARLSRSRSWKINNPAHQDAIAAALQEASLIRGGLVIARKTGRLPDDLQNYLAEKGGTQYIDTLYNRYFKGGRAGLPDGVQRGKGILDEAGSSIVQNDLLDELKKYKVEPQGTKSGVVARNAAEYRGHGRRPTYATDRIPRHR